MAAKSSRKPAKTTARKPAPKAKATKAAPLSSRKIRPGFVSHTELASSDPPATKAWASKVLGWKFAPPMAMPNGSQYHMWDFGNQTGGGIRGNGPQEPTGTVPYVEVADIKAAHRKAVEAGAVSLLAPDPIPGGMGWVAVVQAPGGVAIGFWSDK